MTVRNTLSEFLVLVLVQQGQDDGMVYKEVKISDGGNKGVSDKKVVIK